MTHNSLLATFQDYDAGKLSVHSGFVESVFQCFPDILGCLETNNLHQNFLTSVPMIHPLMSLSVLCQAWKSVEF